MKKRISAVIVLLLLVGMLSACGGSAGTTTQQSAQGSVEEKAEKVTVPKDITEADIIGRWICTATKEILVFKEGGAVEYIQSNGFTASTGTGVTVKNNTVSTSVLGTNIDSDHMLEYDGSGEIPKLKADNVEFIKETDYYAGLEKFSLGDTFSTDSADATVKSLDFISGGEIINYLENNARHCVRYMEADKTYAAIEIDISNLSKQEFQTANTVFVVLDYNNGFQFSTVGDENCLLVDNENSDAICASSNNGSNGISISDVTISPLDTRSYTLYIPCADKVAEDENATYVLYVTLPTENGIKEFAVGVK